MAKQADVIVLALGESGAQMTGESSSVTRLDLPGNQEDLLEQITALGKPTVLVLFTGRPLAIKWAAAHVPAIVEAWYPGIEAGHAVADVLFGDANPSRQDHRDVSARGRPGTDFLQSTADGPARRSMST